MTARLPRLRSAALACAALALTGLGAVTGGCGCHRHRAAAPVTAIEVVNDCASSWGIDAVEIEDSIGVIDHFDVFLVPCDGRLFEVAPDAYEIRLYWSNADVFVYNEVVADGDFLQIQAVN